MLRASAYFLPETNDMRVVFIGSIEFSWYCLAEILEKKLAEVVGIFNVHPGYSKAISDYRNQRDLAQKYRIPYFWFKNINDNVTIRKIKELRPDLILVFGLSQIVGPTLLKIPPTGVLGTHPALLPRNRGRAPIPWSILKNLKKSGLTFFYLDERADTGDIVDQMSWKINARDDAASIYKKMITAGKKMLVRTLPKITKGLEKRTRQPNKSNYWPQRKPTDGKIDWSWNVNKIEQLIRATTWPYPGAFSLLHDKKLIIWKAKPVLGNFQGEYGEIINVRKKQYYIKCRGGAIAVKKWTPKSIRIEKGVRVS